MPTFTVESGEAGLRLDAFLVRRGLFASAAASRRFLSGPEGRVLVQGRPARKGERVQAGHRVELPEPPAAVSAAAFAVEPDPDLPIAVLYQDEALVAVNKPAGVPSHPLRAGERGTAASAVVARFPGCAAASPDPREGGLVHRLDVGTSGVLIAARRRELWTPLREALSGGGCEKVYLAEVVGQASAMVVEAPIGRVGRRGDHVRVGTGRGLLEARTEIRVRQARGQTTLVEAHLSRGRPHQVRAHLAHAGWPVLGDPVYGGGEARAAAEALSVQGLRLHAASVRFFHPVTGAPILIEAPTPGWGV